MDVYRRKRAISAYVVYEMYILNEKKAILNAVPLRRRATPDARKMDVRCSKVAGGTCAVSHLTFTIPDRNSGAAAAPSV